MKWQSPTIFTAFALFAVWMERKGRWSLFLQAAAGEYVVMGARGSGSGTQSGSSGSSSSNSKTPTTVPPNPNAPNYTGPVGGGTPPQVPESANAATGPGATGGASPVAGEGQQ